MELVSSSTKLSEATPDGFFQSLCGRLFWVFGSPRGRVAVHLKGEGSNYRYTYIYLDDDPIFEGHWRGNVTLFLGQKRYETRRGYCGVLRRYRDWVYLKANGPDGRGEYLRILQCRLTPSSSEYCFFHHWRLTNDPAEHAPLLFEQSGLLPRMYSYPEDLLVDPSLL